MKRRKLWAGLVGTTAVAAGVAVWATQSHSTTAPESKNETTVAKTRQADALLQKALRVQNPKEASGAFKRVLELDPRNKLAWYSLGVIAERDRKTADAVASFDKTLAIDPKFSPALFSEAFLLKSSKPDQAMELLRRAITASPQTAAAAHAQLGAILAENGRDDEAKDEFRQATALDRSLIAQVPKRLRHSVSPSPTPSHAGSAR